MNHDHGIWAGHPKKGNCARRKALNMRHNRAVKFIGGNQSTHPFVMWSGTPLCTTHSVMALVFGPFS